MTDSQFLFVVLVLVYVAECIAWVHSQAVAFRWRWPNRGTWRLASGNLGNPDGGFVAKPFLPALSFFSTARSLPLSISPQGLFSFVPDAPSRDQRCGHVAKLVSWSAVTDVRRCGKTVYIGGEAFVRLDSNRHAQWTLEEIKRLAASRKDNLESSIDQMYERFFDAAAVKKKLEGFSEATGLLRFYCGCLFVLLFAVGPVVVHRLGAAQTWVYLVSALLAVEAAVVWAFFRAHRWTCPTSTDDFWVHVASLVLNPVGATRACDRIARDVVCDFHPLAVAGVVCSAEGFEELARSFLTDLKYPLLPVCPHADTEAEAVEAWSRAHRLDAMEAFLKRRGMSLEAILTPEAAYDDSARSYCPRCRRHFEQGVESCESCGGIATMAWPESVAGVP